MSFKLVIIFIQFLFIVNAQDEEDRIIGGQPVTISQYPYQVSLQINHQHFCGGSIYNHHTIITAAHCVNRFSTNTTGVTVVAGRSLLSDHNGQRISVRRIILHPDYNSATSDYDAAVLHLRRGLHYDHNIRPINLGSTRPTKGTLITITGWGSTRRGGDTIVSNELRVASVKVQSTLFCQIQYPLRFTPRMFCAGNLLGGDDSCRGDSGGPVVSQNEQVGIVSYGRGCGNVLSPGVYTDITTVEDFILKNRRH